MDMKKALFVLMSALSGALFIGCSSTKVINIADLSPVAIVNVAANQTLPYYSDETREDEYGDDEGVLTVTVNKFLAKENPEFLTRLDRVDYADEVLAKTLVEIAGCEVVDKDKVIDSDTYKSLGNSPLALLDTRCRAIDYKVFYDINGKKARLLEKEVGAKSLVLLEFKFNKMLMKGSKLSGKLGGRAEMTAKVYDDKGKLIINKDYLSTSFDTIEISKLNYDRDALVELFPPLIENLINQFVLDCVN